MQRIANSKAAKDIVAAQKYADGYNQGVWDMFGNLQEFSETEKSRKHIAENKIFCGVPASRKTTRIIAELKKLFAINPDMKVLVVEAYPEISSKIPEVYSYDGSVLPSNEVLGLAIITDKKRLYLAEKFHSGDCHALWLEISMPGTTNIENVKI